MGVRSERLGFRYESRRTDAPVEGKGILDLRAPFVLASLGEQPGADMESEVRLVVHLTEFCEGVCCAQEIAFEQRSVFVNRTKDQIKDAPEFDESLTRDESYRTRLGSYYGQGGSGYRDWDDSL